MLAPELVGSGFALAAESRLPALPVSLSSAHHSMPARHCSLRYEDSVSRLDAFRELPVLVRRLQQFEP